MFVSTAARYIIKRARQPPLAPAYGCVKLATTGPVARNNTAGPPQQDHATVQPPPPGKAPTLNADAVTGKKAAAVALKAGSRIFQRVVTPAPALRSIGDVSTDPAAVAVEGYVQGEVKSKLLNPILMRVTRGFGIVLPGLGLWFLGRGIMQGVDRVKQEYRNTSTPRAAAYSFALALGADAINMLTTGVSLLQALQEHAAFLPPDMRHPVQWYGWWASGEGTAAAATAAQNSW